MKTGTTLRVTDQQLAEVIPIIYIAIAKDATAGEFVPTGELTADADPAGTTITLTNTKW